MRDKYYVRVDPNLARVPKDEIHIARVFTERLYKEFGHFLSAVILFGSTVKQQKSNDIDILIVLNDVRVTFTRELTETYRIITEKVMADVSPKLHVQSMTLSSFWEYVRAGDPVAVNILRDGIALIDTGFFDPLKMLLNEGRIRPSPEAVHTYYTMAPASLFRSKQHMLNAVIDLYWAAIDAAHAALMTVGEVPPSPDHASEVFGRRLVRTGKIKKKYEDYLNELYKLSKRITHKEVREISGREYDYYKNISEEFVKEIKKYLENIRR